MKPYYCRKCDRDDVGTFHACFHGVGRISPLRKKPTRNTDDARRIAKLYEQYYGEPFPLGIGNARIDRDRSAANRAWRDTGGWVWELWVIDDSQGYPKKFGSSYTIKECYKDYSRFESSPDYHVSAFPCGKEAAQ